MGIKFRWPIYRPFKISEEEKAKVKAMLNDAKQRKVSYEIPKTLSAEELEVLTEAIDGAIAYLLRDSHDIAEKLSNIGHNHERGIYPSLAGLFGVKMGAGGKFDVEEELIAPKGVIWAIMEDKVIHELVKNGISLANAKHEVAKRSPVADFALKNLLKERVRSPLLPIPPPPRVMKDSEEKPSNTNQNEQSGFDDRYTHPNDYIEDGEFKRLIKDKSKYYSTATREISEILLDLVREVSMLKKTFYRSLEKDDIDKKITEQNIKTLLLRLEDVESQLEGTFFSEDSKNRPIDLLAEDVADLKTKMGYFDEILAMIGDQEPEEAVEENQFVSQEDRMKIGEAFKLIIGSLESGFGDATEESMKIVKPYIQHAFKIYPDLEMHPPLTQARFLYGLCTQPMIVLMALGGQGYMPYFLDVDVNIAMTIASEVFGYKFLAGEAEFSGGRAVGGAPSI